MRTSWGPTASSTPYRSDPQTGPNRLRLAQLAPPAGQGRAGMWSMSHVVPGPRQGRALAGTVGVVPDLCRSPRPGWSGMGVVAMGPSAGVVAAAPLLSGRTPAAAYPVQWLLSSPAAVVARPTTLYYSARPSRTSSPAGPLPQS